MIKETAVGPDGHRLALGTRRRRSMPLAGGARRRRWPDYLSPGWIAFYLTCITAWAAMLHFAGLTVCLEIVAGAAWLFVVLYSLTQ